MKPLTILFAGNFRPFWSTENHLRLSLEELGHEVICLQEDEVDGSQVVAMTKATNCDIFLWVRTWGIKNSGFEMLREIQCPTVAFHLDLYAGLKRDGGIDKDPWWNCRYVFSPDGGSDSFWKAKGINHIWSPPAVYGKECYLTSPDPTQGNDVIFTGSFRGYHEEWKYREQLIEWLMKTYGSQFMLYEHSSGMRGEKLNTLYASSKICIGDSLCLGFNHRLYHSDRTPETLGRGGFLVNPRIPGMEKLYRDREHLVYYGFNDWDGLKQTIDYYLEHNAEREQIREQGHQWVKQHHTYVHRMERVLRKVAQKEGWG